MDNEDIVEAIEHHNEDIVEAIEHLEESLDVEMLDLQTRVSFGNVLRGVQIVMLMAILLTLIVKL